MIIIGILLSWNWVEEKTCFFFSDSVRPLCLCSDSSFCLPLSLWPAENLLNSSLLWPRSTDIGWSASHDTRQNRITTRLTWGLMQETPLYVLSAANIWFLRSKNGVAVKIHHIPRSHYAMMSLTTCRMNVLSNRNMSLPPFLWPQFRTTGEETMGLTEPGLINN